MNQERENRNKIGESNWWTGGYIAPVLVVMFTIFWSLSIYWLIGSRPRDWEYGTLPYVPGESAFTTDFGTSKTPPNQVVLPDIIERGDWKTQPPTATGGSNARP